ncbi:MAG: hypothetical protein EOO13_09810 [Chitinophagaceae bacterium]|nr:MAG: hypothetical protein EOO13_09810 [Chitinophagaceae bacterium]
MKKEIHAWLESDQDYIDGVALYEKYGTNNVLKKLLARSETAFNFKKLVEVLEDLAPVKIQKEIYTDKPADVKNEDTTDLPVTTTLKRPFQEYPKQIRALINERTAIFNQMGKLHRELRLNKRIIPSRKDHNWPTLTPSERRDNAIRIVKCDIEISQIWQKLDYFDSTGELLTPEAATIKTLPEDYAQLLLLRNNLRSNVSKWTANAKKAADDQRKKIAQEKLEEYIKQRNDVQAKIDAIFK